MAITPRQVATPPPPPVGQVIHSPDERYTCRHLYLSPHTKIFRLGLLCITTTQQFVTPALPTLHLCSVRASFALLCLTLPWQPSLVPHSFVSPSPWLATLAPCCFVCYAFPSPWRFTVTLPCLPYSHVFCFCSLALEQTVT